MYLLLTSLVFVVLASCIPFMGNDPRNDQGRAIIAMLHLLCQTVREEMAIVDTRTVVVFGSIAPFSPHVRESSLCQRPRQQANPSLCPRLPCASYGAGSTPDSNRCSQ